MTPFLYASLRPYIKVAAAWIFSVFPFGKAVYHFVQRHVTRTVPRSESVGQEALKVYSANERLLHKYLGTRDTRTFEFGAGWDLLNPLMMARMGYTRQVVVDIERHLDLPSLSLARDWVNALALDAEPLPSVKHVEAILTDLGIEYLAPMDARCTGLASASIDGATSAHTLEHLRPADLDAILLELFRVVRSGGVVVMHASMGDHYMSARPFSFYQASERVWRLWNPPLHYQNRLRSSDFVRAFSEAGFIHLETLTTDIRPVDELPPRLSGRFSCPTPYSLEDLLTVHAHFAFRRP
ncbi:methyltransferase domain-containing protein [Euzebya rosea]|uniref:methyltransferase domain-containing protein n=1 Tax=Euzebya rosea TaxID=2052804 RepID=UPI000D3E079A